MTTVLQQLDDESLAVESEKVEEIKKTIYNFLHKIFDENKPKLWYVLTSYQCLGILFDWTSDNNLWFKYMEIKLI